LLVRKRQDALSTPAGYVGLENTMGPELHVDLGEDPPTAGFVVLVERASDPAEDPGSDPLVSRSRARGEGHLPIEDLDAGSFGISGDV
jgi:hypothetical protein